MNCPELKNKFKKAATISALSLCRCQIVVSTGLLHARFGENLIRENTWQAKNI